MADIFRLPNERARRAFLELRKMGFSVKYSLSVVETLENARSNFEVFGTVHGLLRGDGEKTKAWLQARGYA